MSNRQVSVLSVLMASLMWEVSVQVFWPDSRYIYPLSEMIGSIPRLMMEQGLLLDLWITIGRTLLGFIVAGILGIILGIWIAKSTIVDAISRPFIDFFRPLPSSALIPVATLLPMFGLSERSYFVIIVYGSLWPVLFNTIVGVGEVSRTALDVVRQVPLTVPQRLRVFTLPEAAPEIFTGLKVALSISLILTITAELLIGRKSLGLGAEMEVLKNAGDYVGMYGVILVTALLGWMLNYLFSQIERLHPWLRTRESLLLGEG